MKKIGFAMLAATLLLTGLVPAGGTQEFGKIRALQQRAAQITRQKNDFVARVLTAYKIQHNRNEQGAVIRIFVDDKWLDISAVEIVPLLDTAAGDRQQVTAHELFFFTAEGVLNLVSELTIR